MARRPVPVLAVLALVAVDVVLIWLAVSSSSEQPASAAVTTSQNPAPWWSAAATAPTSPSATPSSSTGLPTQSTTPPAELVVDATLVAMDGKTALRADEGQCGQAGSTFKVSQDGGATWKAVNRPGARVVRIAVRGRNDFWAITTDSSCRAVFASTIDGGTTWKAQAVTSGAWHVLLDGTSAVHAPKGVVVAPCPSGMLAPVDRDNAFVGCSDGRIFSTTNAGQSWTPIAALPSVRALSFPTTATGYAVAKTADCTGLSVLRLRVGASAWTPLRCVPNASGSPGLVVQADGTGLLVTSGGAWRTANSAVTWTLSK